MVTNFINNIFILLPADFIFINNFIWMVTNFINNIPDIL